MSEAFYAEMIDREKLIARAETAKRESRQLDFKGQFDLASAEAWCEIVKDIAAFANSGGGIIVFGAESNGNAVDIDHGAIAAYDPANVTNKFFKYTNVQFSDFEFLEVVRAGKPHAALLVSASEVPLVFTKPGTYDIGEGRQKTAFSQGSVYFRHGAKSEPGNRDDLAAWRDREIERVRQEWLTGVRKVVEAPRGSAISVVPHGEVGADGTSIEARITADPKAAAFVPRNAEEIWPYRQKALLRKVNRDLPKGMKINGHDIKCVNRIYDILKLRPEFAYKPHHLASPQYSDSYAEWLVAQTKADKDFFSKMRDKFRAP